MTRNWFTLITLLLVASEAALGYGACCTRAAEGSAATIVYGHPEFEAPARGFTATQGLR